MEMLGMFKLDEVFLRQAIRTLIPLCGQNGKRQRGRSRKGGGREEIVRCCGEKTLEGPCLVLL